MMVFLSILIALGLLQLWGSGGPVQRDEWFHVATRNVQSTVGYSRLRLLLLVAGPVIIVLIFQSLFKSVLFGLLSLLLYVGVLLYSLGRGDFNDSLHRYLSAWSHGNFESAYEQAHAIGDFIENDAIDNHVSLHEHVRVAFLYEGFERWFAVVFWFLLLGPAGALGYRLSYLCCRSEVLALEDRQLALRMVHYLDWAPARLLAFSFTITGNFVNASKQLLSFFSENKPVPELLDDCALAAISGANEVRVEPTDKAEFIRHGKAELLALESLLSRSVICWVVVLAAVMIFSG